MDPKYVEQSPLSDGTVQEAIRRVNALEDNFSTLEDTVIREHTTLQTLQNHIHDLEITIKSVPDLLQLVNNSTAFNKSLTHSRKCILNAAKGGDSDMILALLGDNVDVHQCDENGDTALHLAAAYGHLNAIILLIGGGAEINAAGRNGKTPLHYAMVGRHQNVISHLSKIGAQENLKDVYGDTALIMAGKCGYWNEVKLVVENGKALDETDKDGNSIMVYAAKVGKWDIVKRLCKKGASIDKYQGMYNNPLVIAIECARADVVKCMIVNKNINNVSTFQASFGQEAFISSAARGEWKKLRDYLTAGIDVNVCNLYDSTALHLACLLGQKKCVEVLLKGGANKHLKNYFGCSPLDYASMNEHKECMYLLK